MAKFELKFIDNDYDNAFIRTKVIGDLIAIETLQEGQSALIHLDKSTAIKFAKTLRTEINKIKEVDNV
jgi:hypothetical protein